jgi:hypothetical protein
MPPGATLTCMRFETALLACEVALAGCGALDAVSPAGASRRFQMHAWFSSGLSISGAASLRALSRFLDHRQ